MCNYGTEEMPATPHPFKKKVREALVIHPQDITDSRTEVASLLAKADESRKRSATLTQQKAAKRLTQHKRLKARKVAEDKQQSADQKK